MRLIVVGGSGLIGTALLDEAARCGIATVGTGHAHTGSRLKPFDARRQRLAELVPDLGPGDWVVLLAAYIDPEWVRRNADEAYALNVTATKRLAEEAWAGGAKVQFVSSEAVFDGKIGGYSEDDSPVPLTTYARQKVETERHLAAGPAGRWSVVRTGWTIDSTMLGLRCPIAATYEGLLGTGARMAEDNVFTLTDVHDTARALRMIAQTSMFGYHHVVSAPPVVRTELAGWIRDTSRLGHRMTWQNVRFDSLSFAEPRPARPWLRNDRFVALTGMAFRTPIDIVQAKVALLDAAAEQPRRATS